MGFDHSEYHQLADAILAHITETIDDAGLELDYEQAGNVLELDCVDGSAIIINKQEALSQIWVATKFGGYHFGFDGEKWFDSRNGVELYSLLTDAISKQGGEQIQF